MQSHAEELKQNIQKYSYGGYSFTVPTMRGNGVNLIPKPYSITKSTYNSKILEDLHTVWNLNKFKTPRTPLEIGNITDEEPFHSQRLRILDMPIKLAGSNEYKIPTDVIPFLNTIQTIVDHEHSILSELELLSYHAYLTIDQSYVQAGMMQRKPGSHVDGFQGARISPKTIINHSYVVSNGTPTVFFPQSFDFSKLDERLHDFFLEMDHQANEEKSFHSKPLTIYLMDAYTVHRASLAIEDCFRTFLRISYDIKEFDRRGNTINPLLPYKWDMVPREAQSTLVPYQPLNDYEINLLKDLDALSEYLKTLKESNVVHYYNFIYMGIHSKDVSIVRLMLQNLSQNDKPVIQELRLMFIAATEKNLEVSLLGKAVLMGHLKRAKQSIKNNLFMDFLLEIINQKPYLLPKKLLLDLIKEYNDTPQGKDIYKVLQSIKENSFWNTKVTNNTVSFQGQLKAKL